MFLLAPGALNCNRSPGPWPTFSRHAIGRKFKHFPTPRFMGRELAAGSIWIAGLISGHPHRRKKGRSAALEALTNAMPVYTFLRCCGRERPGEGTGQRAGRSGETYESMVRSRWALPCLAWTMATGSRSRISPLVG